MDEQVGFWMKVFLMTFLLIIGCSGLAIGMGVGLLLFDIINYIIG